MTQNNPKTLVDPNKWQQMLGSDSRVKKINSALTLEFIGRELSLRSECLAEAELIAARVNNADWSLSEVSSYLSTSFGYGAGLVARNYDEIANKIYALAQSG